MIKLIDIIKEIGDAPAIPPAIVQPSTKSIINADFLKYMMNAENAATKGRKNGIWTPHKSPEGGLPTIGYGHKIQTTNELIRYKKTGISDKDAIKLLSSDLIEANKKVHDYIKKRYNIKIQLTQKQEEMLTEFAFSVRGGLGSFPNFTDAVLRNDIDTMRKEYERKFTPKGETEKKSLVRRNNLFYDRYLR